MYRLNPVRIRQGVIWARLPSFGCPRWMEALVERGEEKGEEEEERRVCVSECVLYKPEPCGVFPHLKEPDCLCYHNPFSLSPSLQTHTHTHTYIHTHTRMTAVFG